MKLMRNRVHLFVCGAVITGSIAAISLPGGIAAAKPMTGVCTSASSSTNSWANVQDVGPSLTISLSGCTDVPDTGGAGSLTMTDPYGGNVVSTVIVWNSGLTSSSTSELAFPRSLGVRGIDCPSASPGFEKGPSFTLKGKFTGGTATNLLKSKYKKDAICAYLSSTSTTGPTLLKIRPGTDFTF